MTHAAGPAAVPIPQLDGVVATQSSICLLSAEDDRLAYRGYDVAELAEKASYEEIAYLLLAGRLPSRDQLGGFVEQMRARHKLPRRVLRLCQNAEPGADPMAQLRTAVSALAFEPAVASADSSNSGRRPRSDGADAHAGRCDSPAGAR